MKGSMNHTISLGDFQGGNLWIHDAAARKGEPNVTSHRLGNKNPFTGRNTLPIRS